MIQIVKLVVFAPEDSADNIRKAIGNAGGGKIGEYTYCSFSVKGVGRFKPSDKANPHIGESGKFEAVNEERIEIQCNKDNALEIIKVIKAAHPYEEVVVDVYPMLQL